MLEDMHSLPTLESPLLTLSTYYAPYVCFFFGVFFFFNTVVFNVSLLFVCFKCLVIFVERDSEGERQRERERERERRTEDPK